MGRGGLFIPKPQTERSARRRFPDGRRPASRSVLRRAFAEDAPALAALKTRVASETFAHHGHDALDAWLGRFSTEEYFRSRIGNGAEPSAFYFIGSRKAPKAMAALKQRDGVAYLGDFYVDSPGRGLGTALLADLLDEAGRQGLTVARADVFTDNDRAKQWLLAHGFELVDGYREQSLGIWVDRLERRTENCAEDSVPRQRP